jgi:hypothetical protein
MARNPCGNTAAVDWNATAAVAFLARRGGVGGGEINKTDANSTMLPTILLQRLDMFR